MSTVFRVHPLRRRRRWLAVLIAAALLVAAGVRWAWRKLHPPSDSDDHDHAPEVPVPITITRLCARPGCSNPVPSANPRAIYCSPACRQAVYRERQEATR